MTDKPIPFFAPMVAALLAGSKTQTRRILGFQPANGFSVSHFYEAKPGVPQVAFKSPVSIDGLTCVSGAVRYAVGDRLYVRESYYQQGYWKPTPPRMPGTTDREKWIFVPEGDPTFDTPAEFRKGRHHKDPWTVAWHKRLGRFMPRAYSRLTLLVTDVRVERLQDISEADAIAEGIEHVTTTASGRFYRNFQNPNCPMMAYGAYRSLWDEINGPGAWDENPWVVAVSFTVERGNIDQVQQ